ncbi:MAG: IS630 family transposase [Alphaproteobacteria bacterium]
MRTDDTRKESQKGQDGIRRKAVGAVLGGMSQSEAARVFGVSRTSLWTWVKAYRAEGEKALTSKKRGRKKAGALTAVQAASIRKSVIGKNPGQLRLPGFLWTRDLIGSLILRRFGVKVSRWTVGRYLQAWGMTVQKPAKRALEQNPAQVRYWLDTKYPAIARTAKEQDAEILWGDEMGLRSDHQSGTTWGAKGKTPIVHKSGKRFSCNMLSAISNRGKLSFMVFAEKFTSAVFITFLERLAKHNAGRKIFLIVDRHRVHTSNKVMIWLSEQKEQIITLFYLPAYSPELNPDELLNNAAKGTLSSKIRAQNKEELQSKLRSYLRSTQRRPERVKNFFKGKHVAYAQVG